MSTEIIEGDFYCKSKIHGLRPCAIQCDECNPMIDFEPQQTEIVGGLVGWECPRCRTIHSPFVKSCGCHPPTKTSTTFEYGYFI